MLSVEDINAGYGEVQVLHDVDLKLGQEEIVSVIGPNGAGKTTLMRVLAGLLRPGSGHIRYEGSDITDDDTDTRIKAGLALVPEERNLFRTMSIQENLVLGSYTAREDKKWRLERVYELFPKLKERKAQRAGTISGGEAQMLSIGRSLMTDPDVLLLDEPSLGLAPKLIPELFETIQEINDDGVAVLIVEQEMRRALTVSDVGYLLENGSITVRDRASKLLNDPEVIEKYLGAE
jgi:branched-chain amino acid transport system ATP-binding protein